MGSFDEEFEKIRNDRLGVVQSGVYEGIKALMTQIYPDEAHFIYELLQNAEDARAHAVYFILRRDELVFGHDGEKQFDAEDIESITNIGSSTKKDDYVQAGKFGIGFKSVFAFTETPRIYCDTIDFEIRDLLLPEKIEPLRERKQGITEFHFPFDSPKISPEDACRKISQGLLGISNDTMLFLNNIREIRYELEYGRTREVKSDMKGNLFRTEFRDGDIMREEFFWKATKKAKLHERELAVDAAFPVEVREGSLARFIPGDDKVFITFLAGNERSGLKFYLNAPFGCTPARDTVNKGDGDNELLVRELAGLVTDSMRRLRDDNLLKEDFLDVMPFMSEFERASSLYVPIAEAIHALFREEEYIPTISGEYVAASNAILTSDKGIVDILSIEDIRILYKNRHMQLVRIRSAQARGYRFLKAIGVLELTPGSVLEKIAMLGEDARMEWICGKSHGQLEAIYAFLCDTMPMVDSIIDKYKKYASERYINSSNERFHEYAKAYENALEEKKRIGAAKIVLGADGDYHAPGECKILRSDVEMPEEFITVHPDILENEKAVQFLKSIGVTEFTERELEKYRYSLEIEEFNRKLHSICEDDDPLEVARDILDFISRHKPDEADFDDVRYIWAKAKRGEMADSEKLVLASAKECYLDAPLVDETGFRFAEAIHKRRGVQEIYLKLEVEEKRRWIDFLKQQGIFHSIEIRRINTGYRSGGWDYVVDNLREYIALGSPYLNHYIWEFFTAKGKWENTYSRAKLLERRGADPDYQESFIIKVLKNSAWVEDKCGKMRLPSEVSVDTIARGWSVNEENGFLKAVGFGEDQRRLEEWARHNGESERQKRERDEETVKGLGFSSVEEAKRIAESAKFLFENGVDIQDLAKKKFEKIEKEKSRKKNTLQESIAEAEGRSEPRKEAFQQDGGIDDVQTYGSRNPERYAKKVKESIAEEGAPKKEPVLQNRTPRNEDERHFVKIQYDGCCQICGKAIIKKDGTRYFEATDLLDTGKLKSEYLKGMSTGWNTLCLCPNCAAEWKYGDKSLENFFEKARAISIEPGYAEKYEFYIRMQGEDRILSYTPQHLIVLKSALEYYEESERAEEE